jgi:hypothetical protein
LDRDIVASTPSSALGLGARKREEPEGGFDPVLSAQKTKTARTPSSLLSLESKELSGLGLNGAFKVVEMTHSSSSTIATSMTGMTTETTATSTENLHQTVVESSEEMAAALMKARVRFYHSVTTFDLDSLDIQDDLDNNDLRSIQARSRSDPSLILLEVKVQEGQP